MTELTVSVAPAEERYASRHAWRTLAISSLAVFAMFLDTTVLFVAFPDIVRSFPSVSSASLSWVLNAYTITFAALLVPAGKMADRIGHKRAFLTGSAVFTTASLLCAVAPSVEALVVFRIAQAVGAAALLPSSLALVLRSFPRERIPVAVAIWGAIGAVAGAIGPSLGSALVDAADWRWVFLINLPVGLLTATLGPRLLEESKDSSGRIPSPFGVVLIAAAAALICLAVVQTDSWGWLDRRTVGAAALGGALLVGFVRHQQRSSAPALDLDLFASSNYRWANLATIAFGTAFSAMFFGSILFLTSVWRWSILDAGLGVSPGPLLVAVLAPIFGRLAARTGQRPLLLAGGIVFATGALWRLVFLQESPDYVAGYLPSMLFTGTGVALCLPQLSSVVAQSLPPNRLGVGGAANQALRQFGGTLGVALAIAFVGGPTLPADAVTRFDTIWWLLIVGGLAVSLLALPLRTRPQLAISGGGTAIEGQIYAKNGAVPQAAESTQSVAAPAARDAARRSKVVLVTGASSGIGEATARLLASKGYRVFGTSRNANRAPAAGVRMLPLDVRLDASVTACIEAVLHEAGRLDVLINNAGYELRGALEEVSVEQAKAQFETNFFGGMRMINAALPFMRQQRGGQIVNISSLLGLMAAPFLGIYSASKFAVEGYSEALRHEVKPFGIKVSLVEAGFLHTSLSERGQDGEGCISDYGPWRKRMSEAVRDSVGKAPGPELVAKAVVKIVERGAPRLRYRVGWQAKRTSLLRRVLPEAAFEAGVRRTFRLDNPAN